MQRRSLPTGPGLVLAAILLAGSAAARAEVSVNMGLEGRYSHTSLLVEAGEGTIRFWAPVRAIDPARILNPDGDVYGDGRPALAEVPGDPFPLAVWSRTAGSGRSLIWSRWETSGWRPATWLHDLPGPFVDRDPILAAAPDGSVHLVWWREEGDSPRMYWSRYLAAAGWSRAAEIACRPVDQVSPDAPAPPIPPVPALEAAGPSGRCVPSLPQPVPSTDSESNDAMESGEGDGLTDDPDVLP